MFVYTGEGCVLYDSGKYGLSKLSDSYIARAGVQYCKETFPNR